MSPEPTPPAPADLDDSDCDADDDVFASDSADGDAIVTPSPPTTPDVTPTQGVDDRDDATRYLDLLTEGANVPAHTQGPPPSEPPPWLDLDKFRRGQSFATEHLFGLAYAEMLSLLILFSFPSSLAPLIFTGNSDTPFKAFKRYLSTGVRVLAWFEGDPWGRGEARRQVCVVRGMHDAVQRRLEATPADERRRRCHLDGSRPLWAPLSRAGLLQAEQEEEEVAPPGCCPFYKENGGRQVNQAEMALTQFGFVGLMLLRPERFGAPDATDEDLDAFAHMWRGLAYLLGVEDRFNLCDGDLDTVRKRCQKLVDEWVCPTMQRLSSEWEHMSRCVVAGVALYVPGPPFAVSLTYLLTDVLGLPAPRLRSTLCLADRATLLFVGTLLRWLMWLAPLRHLYNWLLRLSMKRAQHATPEWLGRAEARVYPYQRQQQPRPTVSQL